MHDPTPAPFGAITRRWTHLTDDERDRHAQRLLRTSCAQARIGEPDGSGHYRTLLEAAVAGDFAAFSWLATSHRPLLLLRGRDLFTADPAEWGSVCLELLHTTFRQANPDAGRWLRRQVVQRLGQGLAQRARQHLARSRTEQLTDPTVLVAMLADRHGADVAVHQIEMAELATALTAALDPLDPATREALYAVAEGRTITAVAESHGLSHAALWQRLHRARERLQPEFADFHRTAA